MNKKGESEGGIGFLGILLAIFVALKLAKVITWSWWVVLAPLWIEIGLIIILVIIIINNNPTKWKF